MHERDEAKGTALNCLTQAMLGCGAEKCIDSVSSNSNRDVLDCRFASSSRFNNFFPDMCAPFFDYCSRIRHVPLLEREPAISEFRARIFNAR